MLVLCAELAYAQSQALLPKRVSNPAFLHAEKGETPIMASKGTTAGARRRAGITTRASRRGNERIRAGAVGRAIRAINRRQAGGRRATRRR